MVDKSKSHTTEAKKNQKCNETFIELTVDSNCNIFEDLVLLK